MKHIRPDKTFIYYYFQMWNETWAGVRVGRSDVWVIDGSASDPEKLAVQGGALELPISGQTSEGFKNVTGQLVDQHPELERLLAGQIHFDEVADDSN